MRQPFAIQYESELMSIVPMSQLLSNTPFLPDSPGLLLRTLTDTSHFFAQYRTSANNVLST